MQRLIRLSKSKKTAKDDEEVKKTPVKKSTTSSKGPLEITWDPLASYEEFERTLGEEWTDYL